MVGILTHIAKNSRSCKFKKLQKYTTTLSKSIYRRTKLLWQELKNSDYTQATFKVTDEPLL